MGNVLKSKEFKDTAKEAGTEAVSAGTIYAYFREITTTIFFLIFLIVGIVLVTRHGKKYISVPGKISKINNDTKMCTHQQETHSTTDSDNHTTSSVSTTTYNCNFNITYTPKNQSSITTTYKSNNSVEYDDNEKVTVWYPEDNVNQISLLKPTNLLHIMGIISIIISVFLFFACIRLWLNLLLVTHSKVIAGTEGVAAGAGIFKGTVENVGEMFNFRY